MRARTLLPVAAACALAWLPAAVTADGALRTEVAWHLYNKDILGSPGNGFSTTCGAAGAKTLVVTARSDRTGQQRVTRVPCPDADSGGNAQIDLPDGGPFSVSARIDGRPKSSSTIVCHVKPGGYADVWIFAAGCNEPKCTDACRGR